MTGTVKWFNAKKGYGFITANDTEEDFFVHYSKIIADGFKTLTTGQAVEFQADKDDEGRTIAVDVKAV